MHFKELFLEREMKVVISLELRQDQKILDKKEFLTSSSKDAYDTMRKLEKLAIKEQYPKRDKNYVDYSYNKVPHMWKTPFANEIRIPVVVYTQKDFNELAKEISKI